MSINATATIPYPNYYPNYYYWPSQPVYPALGPNYCTKCASYYATPGTCNCYATYKSFPVTPTVTWICGNNGEPPATSWTLTTSNGEPGETWNILNGGSGQE